MMTTVLAAIDVDRVTDWMGIPLALVLVGLLVLIDLVEVGAGELPIPGFLARRRTLFVASAVVAATLVALVVYRIEGLTA